MLEINLLPKEYQKKRFRVALEKNTLYVIGIGFIVLILLSAYSMFFQVLPANSLEKKIVKAQEDAREFEPEIALIKKMTDEKNLLLARMRTIEVLDRNREAWVNIVSDLSSRIPRYLWLTNFEQLFIEGETVGQGPLQVKIEGKTFSINSLATFLIRLKKSPYLDDIEISAIELVEEKIGQEIESKSYEAYNFTFNCKLLINGKSAVEGNKILAVDKSAAGSEF